MNKLDFKKEIIHEELRRIALFFLCSKFINMMNITWRLCISNGVVNADVNLARIYKRRIIRVTRTITKHSNMYTYNCIYENNFNNRVLDTVYIPIVNRNTKKEEEINELKVHVHWGLKK